MSSTEMTIACRPSVSSGSGTRRAAVPLALTGLSLSMLLASLGTSSANVALPTLAKTFNAPFKAVQWVVVAYLLAMAASIVSFGRLGDRIGPRRPLRVGLIVFCAASLACGLAPALWSVIVARAAQGLGAAVMMALTVAFVGAIVPNFAATSAPFPTGPPLDRRWLRSTFAGAVRP